MHCSSNHPRVTLQDHASDTVFIYLAPPFHSRLIFAHSAQVRWGGARVQDRPTVSGVFGRMYLLIYCKFRAKMGAFLYFWVMSGNFHSFLPNFLIWEFFGFNCYFLWIFQAKNGKKCSVLTFVRLKTGIRWNLFDLENCEHIHESIKLIIGYCTYFIGFSLDFLMIKCLFFT